jgi:flagellar hook-associated protein 1 FlgK
MSIINTALTGTLAAQAGLTTTSQNVANLATPGYTRQGILLSSAQPARGGLFAAGDGVNTPLLFRFSDDYKNLQKWSSASILGQHSTSQPYLTQLEQVMGDDASNINGGMDAFFSALNAASMEPTSSPLRQQVISAANVLSKRFNSLNQVLAGQRAAIMQQRPTAVTQVNSLSSDIAKLNEKIAAGTATGVSTSGLVDERDNKIDQLASLVGIQVVNQPDGTRSISLHGGQPLVVGSLAAQMQVQSLITGGQTLQIVFAKQIFGVPNANLGGQLGSLANYEDNVLLPLTTSISDMAQQVSSRFNAQFTSGFDINGNPGQPLFAYNASSSASMLQITAGIQPQELGFSSDPAQPGNSDNLLLAIDQKNQPITVSSLGSVLMGDAYTQLVSKLGTDSQQNIASLSVAQTVRDHAVASWKSTSGVNSDEEAMNLVQFQQMYQANMKVISVANQLFDSTLAMIN